jgi:hypothetical protein
MRFTLLLLFVTTQGALAQELPTIDVIYQSPEGSIFDRNCSRITKTEAKPEWIAETVRTESRGVNRAWEIVSDIEGYEPFLNELKALPKSAAAPK